VIEFLHLDEEIETDQWRQAELTHTYSAPDGTRDGRMSIPAWAGQVHKSPEHIRVLWRMWDNLIETGGHRLAKLPTFNEVYQVTKEGPDWREKQALRRATSALGKLEPAQQAQAIGQALMDPATANAVMADPQVRSHSREAIDRSYQRDRIEPQPRERDGLDHTSEKLDVLAAFDTIRAKMLAIAEGLGNSTIIHTDESYRSAVLTSLEYVHRRAEIIKSIVEGGESIDQALTRMQAGDQT
jgi:hypothetical protein